MKTMKPRGHKIRGRASIVGLSASGPGRLDRGPTAFGSAAPPPSRSTIAPALSRAMSETLDIAWARVPAICFSASAISGGELVVERFALRLGLGRGLVARRLGEGLGVGAGLGQHLLVRGRRRVRLLLHLGRLVEVLGDSRRRFSITSPIWAARAWT